MRRFVQSTSLTTTTLVIASLFAMPAQAMNVMFNFEDSSLGTWLPATTGGSGSTQVVNHNGSKMAAVGHVGSGPRGTSSTTSTSLSHDFTFSPSSVLSFDMHAIANSGSDHGVTRHGGSGVTLRFLNAFNIPIGTAGLYNYSNPALLGPKSYSVDTAQHNYSAKMEDFASLAGIGSNGISKIGLVFEAWGQFSSGGGVQPDVAGSASVWFDNVAVSAVPEPATLAFLLSGTGALLMIARRHREATRVLAETTKT